jgi:hypothetical protein
MYGQSKGYKRREYRYECRKQYYIENAQIHLIQ